MIASKRVSSATQKQCQHYETMWDTAILDAEGEIRILTLQLARLRQAISIFRANKRDGVEWPEQKSPEGCGRSIRST
jgi:hypothetical protein